METDNVEDVVTLVVKHSIKTGSEAQYEAWLRKTVGIASHYPGHLGVDVIREQVAGLHLFTSVLRFCNADALQQWLGSDERKLLVTQIQPLLAEGDHTEINRQGEFWFTPGTAVKPPRWKQAVITFFIILPLVMAVPILWSPVFASVPALGGYLPANILVTVTVVLLVVYVFMPLATRLFEKWLVAAPRAEATREALDIAQK